MDITILGTDIIRGLLRSRRQCGRKSLDEPERSEGPDRVRWDPFGPARYCLVRSCQHPCDAKYSREKQELLALRFAAKLRAPEIAAITDRSVHTVRKQLERTIQELRAGWYED